MRKHAKLAGLSRAVAARRVWVLVLAAVVLLAGFVFWKWRDYRREFVIAFLERNAFAANPATKTRTRLFEQIHRRAIEHLVKEWNAQKRPWRLRLLEPDPEPPGDDPTAIARRYATLASLPNLVMVLDNHWGADIQSVRAQLQAFPVPIVFLNADHDKQDFGPGRFFVGNSDPVPSEIVALLPKVMETAGSARAENFVFVSETDYRLTKHFEAAWREGRRPGRTVYLPSVVSETVREEKREEIANGVQELAGGSPNARKFVVLNAHGAWGEALLAWLDEHFTHLTVITYQSALGFTPEFTFGRHGTNELILLSTSLETIPEKLFLRFQQLRREYPEPFQRRDAPFFVRRCVLAMDLCANLLRSVEEKAGKTSFPRGQEVQQILRSASAAFRPGVLQSSFGQHRFTERGEVLGQNRFLLHKNHLVSSYSFQPNYHYEQEEGLQLDVVRNAQIGIQNIRVRDIDIEASTFRAEFYYWVRVPREVSAGVSDPRSGAESKSAAPFALKLIDYQPDSGGDGGERGGNPRLVAEEDLGFLRQSLYQVSGTFRLPLHDWRYPFDRHRLKIELQSPISDRELHLSRETRPLEALGEDSAPEVNGWAVSDHYTAVNSRETNPIPVPFESRAGRSAQYDTIVVTFDVQRYWWSTLPLLWLPLLLLAGASLAVLYITFGDNAASPASATESGWQTLETLKTQTELSLGCTLAVITYLISYATLAPQIDTPTYADALVGFTLAFATFNFIFVVAISQRENNRFFLALKPALYRRWSTCFACLGIGGWLLIGIFLLPLASAGTGK